MYPEFSLNILKKESGKKIDTGIANILLCVFYNNLFEYFFSETSEWDKSKGLILAGPKGVGKTIAFEIINLAMHKRNFDGLKIIESRHILREYKMSGELVIEKYGRNSFVPNQIGLSDYSKPITIMIDDVGLEETNVALYKNNTNVIAEIIIDRYKLLKLRGVKTHATTNLQGKKNQEKPNGNSLEEIYGPRAFDRIKEMFNWIELEGESFR